MAVAQLQAPLAPLEIAGGMQVVFEAISPTTGLAITGVTVSAVSISGVNLGGDAAGAVFASGPFMLVPGPNA